MKEVVAVRNRLKDVTLKIGSGATPRGGASVYKQNGVPFVRSQNVLDLSISAEGIAFLDEEASSALQNVTVVSGDVLINITGDSVARVAIWEAAEEARVSQHVAILRPDPSYTNSRYLQYWLVAEPQKSSLLTFASAGASRPALTKAMLERFPFGPHDLSEQKAIAEVLGALDDKIAVNRRVADSLLQLGEAVLQSASTETVMLQDAATIVMGSSPKGEDLTETGLGLPFFQGVRDFGRLFPEKRVFTESPVRIAPPRATLVAVRAPIGKVNLAVERTVIGRGLASVSSDLCPASLYFALRSNESMWDEYQGGGTVFASVTGREVREAKLMMPRADSASAIEKRLVGLLDRAVAAEQENRALAAARDELLPLLMSGKISVKDAEGRIDDATAP